MRPEWIACQKHILEKCWKGRASETPRHTYDGTHTYRCLKIAAKVCVKEFGRRCDNLHAMVYLRWWGLCWWENPWLFECSSWCCPAWCSGGHRPLIAGCLSLHRLGINLPVTRPARDANLRPPASESRPLTNWAIGAKKCINFYHVFVNGRGRKGVHHYPVYGYSCHKEDCR